MVSVREKKLRNFCVFSTTLGNGNHGVRGQAETALSVRAYSMLKAYIESPTNKSAFDALVDMPRVNALGLSSDCIGLWLKNSKLSDTNAVREAVYRAIFVNTLGMTGKTAIEAVMGFFDGSHITNNGSRHGSSKCKKDKMRGWTKLCRCTCRNDLERHQRTVCSLFSTLT